MHDPSTRDPGPRPDVDDAVRGPDRLLVVFDDQDGVAEISQPTGTLAPRAGFVTATRLPSMPSPPWTKGARATGNLIRYRPDKGAGRLRTTRGGGIGRPCRGSGARVMSQ